MNKIYPTCYVSNTCHTDNDLLIHKLSTQCHFTCPKLYKYSAIDQNNLVYKNRSLYVSHDNVVICRSSSKREQEIKSMITHVYNEFEASPRRDLFGKKHVNVDQKLIPIYLASIDASQIFLLGSFNFTINSAPSVSSSTAASSDRPKNVHSKEFFKWAKEIIGNDVICKPIQTPMICGLISWYAKTFISSERYKYVEGQKSPPKNSTYCNGKTLVPMELYFYDINTKCWYRCNLWVPSYEIVWVPINLREITPINFNNNIVIASSSSDIIPSSCIKVEVSKLLSSFDDEIEEESDKDSDGSDIIDDTGDKDYVDSGSADDKQEDDALN